MRKDYSIFYESPLGTLEIKGNKEAISGVSFRDKPGKDDLDAPEGLFECRRQLDEYFQGNLRKFEVKTELRGTGFQKKVWKELYKIPYGKTLAYGELAGSIGNPKAVRAVGGANARNNIVIIYPCHRVIGSDGSLVGFGGGLWRKEWLLEHERKSSATDKKS